MFDKIKTYWNHPLFKQFTDVRNIGLYTFGAIVLSVAWSGARVIQTNYDLQRKIAKLEQENAVKQLENQNTKFRNEYLKTDQFLELAARRQFGKAAPGEKLYIVPKEVAYANSTDLSQQQSAAAKAPTTKSRYQKNFDDWMDLLFHRQ